MKLFAKKPPSEKLGLTPDTAFIESTKARFLAAFDVKYGTRPAERSSFVMGFRIAASVLAVFAIVAGVSAYADSKNVPPDSAFYSFKRLGENVQLMFASPAAKSELQANFAVRRADEIADLETHASSSAVITRLNKDLDSAIAASINDQARIDSGDATSSDSTVFCAKFLSTIGAEGSAAHDALLSHPKIIQKIERKCGAVSVNEGNISNNADDEDQIQVQVGGGVGATVTTTATSTVNSDEGHGGNDGGKTGDNGDKGGDSGNSSGDNNSGSLLNARGGVNLKVGIE